VLTCARPAGIFLVEGGCCSLGHGGFGCSSCSPAGASGPVLGGAVLDGGGGVLGQRQLHGADELQTKAGGRAGLLKQGVMCWLGQAHRMSACMPGCGSTSSGAASGCRAAHLHPRMHLHRHLLHIRPAGHAGLAVAAGWRGLRRGRLRRGEIDAPGRWRRPPAHRQPCGAVGCPPLALRSDKQKFSHREAKGSALCRFFAISSSRSTSLMAVSLLVDALCVCARV
jgi:hypothetical protein